MWEGALDAFPVGTQEIILSQSRRDWINWEFWINIHITVNVYKLDNQQDLLYSAGNYIQYPVITYSGKESEKEYMHISKSPCCPPGTHATL